MTGPVPLGEPAPHSLRKGLVTVPGQSPDFSGAVIDRGLVYTSGLVALAGLSGPGPAPAFRDQVREVLDRLTELLSRAGSGLDHVLRVEAFITDPAHLGQWNDAFVRAWPTHRPARSTLLAHPPLRGALVEVQAVAAIRQEPACEAATPERGT